MTELLDVLSLLAGGAKVAPKLGATAARVGHTLDPMVQKQLFKKPFTREIKDINPQSDIELRDFSTVHPPSWNTMPQTWETSSQIPEAARNLGYDIPAFHSTGSKDPFNEFNLPSDELGIHAGTPKAAVSLSHHLNYRNENVIPLLLKAQNPLFSHDLGGWTPNTVANYLQKVKGWEDPLVKELAGKKYFNNPAEANGYNKDLRSLITDRGYDSVKYLNTREDPGSYSYMVLNPNQLRVPWAKFDPSKVNSGNIFAGLGAAGMVLPTADQYYNNGQ